MKTLLLIFSFLSACFGMNETKSKPESNTMLTSPTASKFYDFKMQTLDGKTIDFASFKGKKVLLVNTASQCGYTPQYADLQKLHEQHGNKVVVIGFPANNFGGQEPGSSKEIASFCQQNYGVTFQMMDKISVTGTDQHPLYQWLTKKDLNGWNEQAPKWNFSKYLVNEKGELVKYFASGVKPTSQEILDAING